MSFGPGDAYNAARSAGFSDADAVTAAAIALAESGGNETAVSRPNTNGTVDTGAWQINSVHRSILASGNPLVLTDNARMAYTVYKNQGFKAWSAYRSGTYKKFIPAVTAAKETPATIDPPKDAVRDAKTPDPTGLVGTLARFQDIAEKGASDAVTVLVAVALFTVGVVILLRKTDAAKNLGTVVKLAATKGVVK